MALWFTRTLAHPPEKVWQAITDPEHLASWFPTTIEGERAAGATLRFSFPGGQSPPFDGEMVAYEPPSVMEIRWGPDTVRLELRPTKDGTELTLLDTLEERGKAARDGAGWHTCLDALERSRAARPTRATRWTGGRTFTRLRRELRSRGGDDRAARGI